jgi:hypothetical protein
MSKISGLAYTLTLAAASLVQAQEVVQETQTTNVPASNVAPGVRRASQILGSTVRLEGNNNFGTVSDIVFDENGTMDYLVVTSSGKYVMLPWSAGNMNFGERFVTYTVTPQAIQPLFFNRGAWPNVYGDPYMAKVRRVFPGRAVRRQVLRPVPGAAPAAVPAPAPGAVKERVKVKPNGDIQVKERIK